MSVSTENGEVVHFPKRRDVFRFDDEVAAIFDDMAPRSIPLYNEVHRLHASMLRDRLGPGSVIVDVGASTGMTLRAIEREFGQPLSALGLKAYALDISPAMVARLRTAFPDAFVACVDLTYAEDLPEPADVAFAYYVLQFIRVEEREDALRWLARNVRPGGALVLGQKDRLSTPCAEMFDAEYYKFRRDNGYTQAEIDAKTAALKNSMWPVTYYDLQRELARVGFYFPVETTRWLHFSTLVAFKRG